MGFDLSRTAKRAKEQTKAAAGKTARQATKAKSAASPAPKVKKLLGAFDSAVPVLRDLGYKLSDVTIKLGVPPSLVASFQFTREVSDEEVTAALRENAHHKLITMLIRMLSKARTFQSMRVAGLKAQSTAVDISFMPGVSVKFA